MSPRCHSGIGPLRLSSVEDGDKLGVSSPIIGVLHVGCCRTPLRQPPWSFDRSLLAAGAGIRPCPVMSARRVWAAELRCHRGGRRTSIDPRPLIRDAGEPPSEWLPDL